VRHKLEMEPEPVFGYRQVLSDERLKAQFTCNHVLWRYGRWIRRRTSRG
jgi:hypothetical protein